MSTQHPFGPGHPRGDLNAPAPPRPWRVAVLAGPFALPRWMTDELNRSEFSVEYHSDPAVLLDTVATGVCDVLVLQQMPLGHVYASEFLAGLVERRPTGLPGVLYISSPAHEDQVAALYAQSDYQRAGGTFEQLITPIDHMALVRSLRRLAARPDQPRPRAPIMPGPAGRLCLVARDWALRIQLRDLFSRHGYAVDAVDDGNAALELLTLRSMDALVWAATADPKDPELLQNLRQRLQSRTGPHRNWLPVLAISTAAQTRDLPRFEQAGAHECVARSAREDELIARLERARRHFETLRARQAETQAQATEPVVKADAIKLPESPVSLPQASGMPPASLTNSAAPTETIPLPDTESRAGHMAESGVFDTFATGLAGLLLRFPWLFLLAALGLTAALGWGATRLTFSSDYRVYFGPENPERIAFESLEKTYTRNNSIVFLISPDDGDVFTGKTLAAILDLTERGWKLPWASRVDSLSNYQHTRARGDELVVRDLVPRRTRFDPDSLAEIRRIALSEELLRGRLISPAGHVAAVQVNVLLPRASEGESVVVAHAARELVREIATKHPGVTIRLTGSIMLDTAFAETTEEEIRGRIPVMFGFLLLLTAVLLRSITGTVATVLVIVTSTASAMGLSGWLGWPITTPSSGAPLIIMTLAIADSVHLLATMFHAMRHGANRKEAIAESLRLNLHPMFLTTAMTAAGFLSMNTSDSPPFHDLGNLVAFGVAMAFVFSILLVPCLMAVLPVRPPRERDEFLRLDGLAEFVIRHRNGCLAGMALLAVLLATGIWRIELNDNFVEYFPADSDFRSSAEYAAENLRGVHGIDYSIPAGSFGTVADPRYLEELDQFTAWLREQPGVQNVDTISTVMKRLNRNMHADDPYYERIPESRDLAAQYLLLYELSLPQGLDLTTQINLDKSASRISVALDNLGNREIEELEASVQTRVKESMPPDMATQGTGGSLMFARISQRNIDSMLIGDLVSVLLISALLIPAFRSVRIGFLSLLPNLLPALMAYGLWGYLHGEVGLAVSVVASFSLGIVVDDTVHFLSKYLRARRELGFDAEDAVRYAYSSVGHALLSTTLILVGGFLVLATSGFAIHRDMGLLTAVTLVIGLGLELLLVAPLLLVMDGRLANTRVAATA